MADLLCSFEFVQAPIEIRGERYHAWEYPAGEIWTEFYRLPCGYFLNFPGKAEFEILEQGRLVRCYPSGADAVTCKQLFIGQVHPLAMFTQGYLVLHASAVELNGKALVFVGDSGYGKSTLAAHLVKMGGTLLTDDGLVLRPTQSGYEVIQGHPSVRLWEDSRLALFPQGMPVGLSLEQMSYSEKQRVGCGAGLAFSTQPCSVRHVFFLGKPGNEVSHVSLETLGGIDLTAELTKHAFILDSQDLLRMSQLLSQVADFSTNLTFSRLSYPRDFSKLDNVGNIILGMCK